MNLENFDRPTITDQKIIHALGAANAEQCRTIIVVGPGEIRLPDMQRLTDRQLQRRHPRPMREAQAAEELAVQGEEEYAHRVTQIQIYPHSPSLRELGLGECEETRVESWQNWFYRAPAEDGGHIVGQVQVLQLRKGAEEICAVQRATLEAHHIDAVGTMHIITTPAIEAWVDALVRRYRAP